MIAVALPLLASAARAGVQIFAVLAPAAALLATAALCSARLRRQFGCAAYLFAVALYALVPVAVRAAG